MLPPIHLAQIEFAERSQIPLAVLLGVRAALDPIELAGQGVLQDRVVEDGINWNILVMHFETRKRDLEEPLITRERLGVLVLVLGGLDERMSIHVGVDHLVLLFAFTCKKEILGFLWYPRGVRGVSGSHLGSPPV